LSSAISYGAQLLRGIRTLWDLIRGSVEGERVVEG
jgi:hypothetical protein